MADGVVQKRHYRDWTLSVERGAENQHAVAREPGGAVMLDHTFPLDGDAFAFLCRRVDRLIREATQQRIAESGAATVEQGPPEEPR